MGLPSGGLNIILKLDILRRITYAYQPTLIKRSAYEGILKHKGGRVTPNIARLTPNIMGVI